MIKYLKHHQIDKQKWDNCIRQSLNGLLYAESFVLDFFFHEWEALVVDDYKTVMPLTKGKKFGINYLYHPIVLQQLGVFSTKEMDGQIIENFLNSIPKQYKFMDIYLNKMNSFSDKTFVIKKNINYELNLNHPYEAIYKNYSKNLKRNIKKAEEKKLLIVKEVHPKIVLDLFIDTTGKRITSYSARDYDKMLKFMLLFSSKNRGISMAAMTHGKKICSAAFFLAGAKRITYLKGASDDSGRNAGALHFLFNHLIRENANKETCIDFGGSNIPSLARFYKSFGAEECVYLQVKKNSLPRIVKWMSRKY